MTKERPIIFSASMVRAILQGRKTQTRRVIKRARDMEFDLGDPHYGPYWLPYMTGVPESVKVRCPYGAPGDRLWVRETWQAIHVSVCPESGIGDDFYPAEKIPADNSEGWWAPLYAATDPLADYDKEDRGFSWRPSIFMPRWASRILLQVTDIRVERLQSITPADCRAEVHPVEPWRSNDQEVHDGAAQDWYNDLWIEINGLESWNANPLVWVVSFKRIKP